MSGDSAERLRSADAAVVLRDVWIRYETGFLLEEISLIINSREIISILGPNGCGKTTLLRVMMGIKEAERGEVTIFGLHPHKAQQRGLIGYLPQGNRHDYHFPLSAYDVVALGRYSRKRFRECLDAADRELISGSLERVEMLEYRDHHFGSLSGGQRQRVLIARALAQRPRLLVLDEPSTGLDAVAQDRFYQILLNLRDSDGLTIVMVSHDICAVSRIVDRVACIKRRIHFHGKPNEMVEGDPLRQVFGSNIYIVSHDDACETCKRGG